MLPVSLDCPVFFNVYSQISREHILLCLYSDNHNQRRTDNAMTRGKGQKEKQWSSQKTKDWATRTTLKKMCDLMCCGSVISSSTKTTQHYLTNTKYKPSRIAVLIHMTHKNYRASRLSVLNYTIHLIIKKYKPSRVAILSHTTRLTNKQYRPFRVSFFNNTTNHTKKNVWSHVLRKCNQFLLHYWD
jgi:hypothetical protein